VIAVKRNRGRRHKYAFVRAFVDAVSVGLCLCLAQFAANAQARQCPDMLPIRAKFYRASPSRHRRGRCRAKKRILPSRSVSRFLPSNDDEVAAASARLSLTTFDALKHDLKVPPNGLEVGSYAGLVLLVRSGVSGRVPDQRRPHSGGIGAVGLNVASGAPVAIVTR
jgi:hypothetical protein